MTRTALITAASRCIGRANALGLAADGAGVGSGLKMRPTRSRYAPTPTTMAGRGLTAGGGPAARVR
jgi:NAD(P)-dependent dehydrogenase (short-subunit alcohol dehydrogenase family)